MVCMSNESETDAFNRRVIASDGYVALTEFEQACSGFDRPLTEYHLESVERGTYVARFARQLIESTDARLLSPGLLARLSGFRTAAQRLRNFEADENPAHLDSLTDDIDGVLDQLAAWPRQDAAIEALRTDAASFRRSATNQLRGVTSEADSAIEALRVELAGLSANVNDVTESVTRLEARQVELATTVDQSIAAWQVDFDAAQSERENAFEARLTELTTAANTAREEAEAAATAAAERSTTQYEATIHELSGLKAKAEQLVGAIGSAGMSGAFQKSANAEDAAATRYRDLATKTGWIWACVAVAVFATPYLLDGLTSLTPETGIAAMFARLTVTVPLIVLFGYYVAESAKHRRAHLHMRTLELNIASIDPYLAEFEPEERSEIKGELARIWFSQEGPRQGRKSSDNPATAEHAINKLAELARETVRSQRPAADI